MTPEELQRWNDAYREGYQAGKGSGQFCNGNPYNGNAEKQLEQHAWQMGFDYHMVPVFGEFPVKYKVH